MESPPVVISARGKHTATFIFLHGLGDTGNGWASTLAAVRQNHVKIICPTAPMNKVSINGGFKMPSWFDLLSLTPEGPEDEKGIQQACGLINKLVEEEINGVGIDPDRIVLGGFSQGGALSLFYGLTSKYRLGGIVALSCWLPLHKKFPGALNASSKAVPCLQIHGDCDPMVPYRWGQLTSTTLKGFLSNHEFKTYKGLGHHSNEQELKDVEGFLARLLPEKQWDPAIDDDASVGRNGSAGEERAGEQSRSKLLSLDLFNCFGRRGD